MYKNYEDKLNTILSNAKGEKVEKVQLESIKKIENFISSWKEFNKNAKKIFQTGDKMLDSLEDAGRNFKNVYNDVEDVIGEYSDFASDTMKVLNNFNKAAKELGMQGDTVPQYKELFNLMDKQGKQIAIDLERLEISLFNYKDNF